MVSWLSRLVGIKIDCYQTTILQQVQKDSLEWLESKRVLYFCRYADDTILAERNLKSSSNEPLNRIMSLFKALPNVFELWSIVDYGHLSSIRFHRGVRKGKVFYLNCISGQRAWIFNSLLVSYKLVLARSQFDAFMIYNFDAKNILPALTIKILGKSLIVDFEDDYELRKGFPGAKIAFRILRHLVNGVIAVNANMARHFQDIPVSIVESFADLSYMKDLSDDREGHLQLLYSGSLDEIRGGDLIVPLSDELTRKGIKHTISVTGSGKYKEQVADSSNENIKYLGFVSQIELSEILKRSHVGLVLQKPDHPFSMGSFPSKVEFYAKQKIPILMIEKAND